MSVQMNPVVCPQCGSQEVTVFANQGKCPFCGVSFLIEPNQLKSQSRIRNAETPLSTLFSDARTSLETFDIIGRISPEYSEQDFVRAVWIKIAKDKAPLSAFEQEIKKVDLQEKQILMNRITATTTYSASIGYNRVETYTDYESKLVRRTYYEDGKEKSYLDSVKEPVTKQRTVTDWQAFHGNRTDQSVLILDNQTGALEDVPYITNHFLSAKKESFSPLSAEESAGLQIGDAARKTAVKTHEDVLNRIADGALPGDEHKDLDTQITVVESSSSLHLVGEYSATVRLGGRQYTEKALSFGGTEVVGDAVVNDDSPERIAKRKATDISTQICRKNNRWITAMLVSAILSVFLSMLYVGGDAPNLAVGIIGMIVCAGEAVAWFFLMRRFSDEGMALFATVQQEITHLFSDYSQQVRTLLDRKFLQLGLAPIQDELNGVKLSGGDETSADAESFRFPKKKRIAIFCLLGAAMLFFFIGMTNDNVVQG